MPLNPIDLRSDTVTRPTSAMRKAMAEAEVGDDVFGEDPTVNALQARAAALFGREAALFVPSGCMANQIAIRLHTQPGDEVITGRWAHSYLYEAGGAAALSGVQITPVGRTGLFQVADVVPELKSTASFSAPTRLLMFENTHNRGGGRVFPLADLEALAHLARERGLRTHLDGARIFNACTTTGIDPSVYGGLTDTLSFCLSKGLGAPVGSMLVGDAETMTQARWYRKLFGGGMRQVGILAAAGLYALELHRARLVDDHALARQFAEGIQPLPGVRLELLPETNIVIFDLDHLTWDAPVLCQAAAAAGVLMLPMGPKQVRAVFHLDVSREQVMRALDVLEGLLERT